MRDVRAVVVVVDAPVLDERLGFEQVVDVLAVQESSRSRPLNDSIHAFCHGEPGSMNTVSTSLKRQQSATARAMNSGPLSKRTNAGAPRSAASLSSVATTLSDVEAEKLDAGLKRARRGSAERSSLRPPDLLDE